MHHIIIIVHGFLGLIHNMTLKQLLIHTKAARGPYVNFAYK